MDEALYHHGIRGQEWGKRNGPPYPLGAGDHSAREKKAGWQKSLNKTSKRDGEGRANQLERALNNGNARLRTGLVACGTYQYGSIHPQEVQHGKILLNKALKEKGQNEAGMLDNALSDTSKKGGKKISETIEQSLENTNPLRGTPEGENNCTSCSIAGILRTLGYDATAKSTGGQPQYVEELLGNSFKGASGLQGIAIQFARSPKAAEKMLVKEFGKNAHGVVGIKWYGYNVGHAFSWVIENGKVRFLDFQNNLDDKQVRKYWRMMDPYGMLTLASLDDLEVNKKELSKWVDIK